MEQLFSPWRSHYMKSFKDVTEEKGCVFCEALMSDQDHKHYLVYRGELVFVLMNLYPYNSGHLMIIPNRHSADFQSLTTEEGAECIELLQIGQKALTEMSKPHAFNIGMNLGRTAGAGIEDHFHWHLVPRWNGDTNFLPVLADVKVVSEDMDQQWKELHRLFDKMKKG